jgi:threonyl-tRNA synthetase
MFAVMGRIRPSAFSLKAAPRALLHSTQLVRTPTTSKIRLRSSPVTTADEEAELTVVLPTNKNSDNLLRIRHSTAHVMAMAVQRLFPKVQVTIGPWIDNGFYYDFFNPAGAPFSEDDLKSIKKEMDGIIKKKMPMVRFLVKFNFLALTSCTS